MPSRPWTALLVEEHLTRLADRMTVAMIITARDELVTVAPDDTLHVALEKMAGDFDQLPVLDGKEIVGLILRSTIEHSGVDHAQRVIARMHAPPAVPLIKLTEPLPNAIDLMVTAEAALVVDPETENCCGLLHYADLNKQAMRIYCYLWLSALEMGMAEVVRQVVPNVENWLPSLPNHKQVTVLGRRAFEQLRNIELHAVEALELSDLSHIAKDSETILVRLGLSKKQLGGLIDHLVDTRNEIMHPVRLLVRSHSDVDKLRCRIADLHRLVQATHDALRE